MRQVWRARNVGAQTFAHEAGETISGLSSSALSVAFRWIYGEAR
jgi:hypothetical protein